MLVTIRLANGCAWAARAASPSNVGAAYSPSPISVAAPTACWRSFRSAVVTRDRVEPGPGVGITDGQWHDHGRDAVAELRGARRRPAPTPGRTPSRRDPVRSSCCVEHARHRAPDDGEHHVVDGALERGPDLARDLERHGDRLESSPTADGVVERHARHHEITVEHRADGSAEVGDAVERGARRVDDASGTSATRSGASQRSRTVSTTSRIGRAAAVGTQSSWASTVGSRVESSSTVAMSTPEMPSVSVWCDLCTRPTCSPRSTPSTNQSSQSGRSRSSTWRHQSLGELEQLASGARSREPGEPHVSGDVEVVGVDPDRAAPAVGHRHDPLAEPGDELQARRHHATHVVEAELPIGRRGTVPARAPRPRPPASASRAARGAGSSRRGR